MAYGDKEWSDVMRGKTTISSNDLHDLLNTRAGVRDFQSLVSKKFPEGTYLNLTPSDKRNISNLNVCDIIDIIKENQAYARIVDLDTKKPTVERYEKRVGPIIEEQRKINENRQKAVEAQRVKAAEAQRQKAAEATGQREAEAPKNQEPAELPKQEAMTKGQREAEAKFNAEKREAIKVANSIIKDFQKRNAKSILFKDTKTKKQEEMQNAIDSLTKSQHQKHLSKAIEQFKEAARPNVGLFNISTPTSAKKAEKLGAKPDGFARQ